MLLNESLWMPLATGVRPRLNPSHRTVLIPTAFPPSQVAPKHAFKSVGEFINHDRWMINSSTGRKRSQRISSLIPQNIAAIRFARTDFPGTVLYKSPLCRLVARVLEILLYARHKLDDTWVCYKKNLCQLILLQSNNSGAAAFDRQT